MHFYETDFSKSYLELFDWGDQLCRNLQYYIVLSFTWITTKILGYVDGRQPLIDDRPLMEDALWWKTTFNGWQPLMEDNLRWKTRLSSIVSQPFKVVVTILIVVGFCFFVVVVLVTESTGCLNKKYPLLFCSFLGFQSIFKGVYVHFSTSPPL